MRHLELILARDCPNVQDARQLAQAAAEARPGVRVTEWWAHDPALPPYAQDYGSPTLLVDGVDVTGQEASGSDCCRVYADNDFRGVPSLAQVLAALDR